MAVLRPTAKALSLQARHLDIACAVGSHQDLQLRSPASTDPNHTAQDAAAQRHCGMADDAQEGLAAMLTTGALNA